MDKQTKNTVSIFNNLADLYQEKYSNVEAYAEGLNIFTDAIPGNNPSVLELASGPGNTAKHVLSRNPNIQLLCTDLSPNMLTLAKVNNPTIDTRIMNANDLSAVTDQYDGILMAFGLPYMSKPESAIFIINAYEKLNSSGVLYLSWIEGLHDQSGFKTGSTGDSIWMNLHELSFIQDNLKECGFNIIYTNQLNANSSGDLETEIVAQKNPKRAND